MRRDIDLLLEVVRRNIPWSACCRRPTAHADPLVSFAHPLAAAVGPQLGIAQRYAERIAMTTQDAQDYLTGMRRDSQDAQEYLIGLQSCGVGGVRCPSAQRSSGGKVGAPVLPWGVATRAVVPRHG